MIAFWHPYSTSFLTGRSRGKMECEPGKYNLYCKLWLKWVIFGRKICPFCTKIWTFSVRSPLSWIVVIKIKIFLNFLIFITLAHTKKQLNFHWIVTRLEGGHNIVYLIRLEWKEMKFYAKILKYGKSAVFWWYL